METFFLGLVGWIGVGLVAGILARPLLPGVPRLGWIGAIATGVGGSLAGGLAATALGFGGIAGFDARGVVFACLCGMIALLLLRSLTLTSDGQGTPPA